MRRLIQATAMAMALALAASGLVACGGDSDEDKIKDVIKTSLTSDDSSVCDTFSSNLLEQQFYEEGEDALNACKEQSEEDPNPSENVEVSNVEIDGDSATADVKYERIGGESDGSDVEYPVELVKEDGDWKIDG